MSPRPAKRRTRGQGEGSIYQRQSDGMWVSVIDLGWQNGKRSRKYLYGKTRAEVAEKLNDALHKQDRGLPVKMERQTVQHFLERWHADVIVPTRGYGTARSYEQHIRGHIVPSIGHKQLTKLSAQDVQRLITERMNAGLAPQTVRSILATLRLALSQAERWDLVPRNVATLVDGPRVPQFEPLPLNPAEARLLLSTVASDRLSALYEVSVRIGLRQGEAMGLRWRDIDLVAGALAVRYSMQWVNKKRTLVEPKTERSRRTIDLTGPLVSALEAHRERQSIERELAGDRWHRDWNLVFCNTKGAPLDVARLGLHFKAALTRAGLAERRWHDLRHTAATLMLTAGVPERVIQEILGHSRLDMTMLYSHVLPPTRREAVARVDALLAMESGGF